MTLEPKLVSSPSAPIRGLSRLQKEALTLVAEGKRNKQICVELGVSAEDLKETLASSLENLGAHNLMHAVSLAILLGHIKPMLEDKSD